MLVTLEEQDIEFSFDVQFKNKLPYINVRQVLDYFNANIYTVDATKYETYKAVPKFQLCKDGLRNFKVSKYVAPIDITNLVELFATKNNKPLVPLFAYMFHKAFKDYTYTDYYKT